MFLTKIDWAPSETLFKIGSFGIHYYSLMFIIAFGLGYYIIKKIFDQEKIPLENILILTDEIHLPFGTIRLKGKGSPAGHNGLKDIESQLNTPNYARLRFGIGQKQKAFDQVKFVLDLWEAPEEKLLHERIEQCTEAILSFGLEGLSTAMNRYNGK